MKMNIFPAATARRMLVALLLAAPAVTLVAAASSSPALSQGHTIVRSGPTTVALVELYTSEGCSSCPPADQQLADLNRTLGADRQAIALALHVNYWDAIGWRDTYAQPVFGERHSALVHANGHQTAYTPHFFINGVEQSQDAAAWRRTVQNLNAQPAQASIAVDVAATASGTVHVVTDARAAQNDHAVVYVALAQNGLASRVTRGENRGSRLTHEHVVRSWVGPLALEHGALHAEQDLPLPAGADPAALEVVAFVSDGAAGNVLQAVQAKLSEPTAKVAALGAEGTVTGHHDQ